METHEVESELDRLIERFRPADEGRMILTDTSTAWVWTLDAKGDGVGLARSATASGLLGQVEALLKVRYNGHSLRKLVVAERMSGNRRFHERPDLLEVEQGISDGWCSWVAIADFDRVSRTVEAGELFIDYLRETGTELVVTSVSADKPVDLDGLLQVGALGRAAEAERERVIRRLVGPRSTHT